jgi:hypothetical protein
VGRADLTIRLSGAGDLDDSPSAPTLFGLVVSPRTRSSYLGYERIRGKPADGVGGVVEVASPRHIPGALEDIGAVEPPVIRLRAEFHRYSPILRTD